MSAPLREDIKNLRAWLHRIEEACAMAGGPEILRAIRDAAARALAGLTAPGGPGLTIRPTATATVGQEPAEETTAATIDASITIIATDGTYTVRRADRAADGLCWDEMIGQVINLTIPGGGGRLYAMRTEAERTAEKQRHEERLRQNEARHRSVVTIEYTVDGARQLSSGLADILCWAAGFRAARSDDPSSHPMGIHAVRDFRDVLEREIARTTSNEH